MRIPNKALLLFLCNAPWAWADAPAVPLSPERTAALLECAIPLSAARQNLESRGYAVLPGAGSQGFSTGFKVNDGDGERRLLGSVAVERARQYLVSPVAGGIRFSPRHRETVFATGVLGRRDDAVREYDLPLTESGAGILADMRSEVCGSGPARDPAASSEIEQYVIDRCKAGDDRACNLLRLR